MAEPATTAPLRAAGHERDALLATKLHRAAPAAGAGGASAAAGSG